MVAANSQEVDVRPWRTNLTPPGSWLLPVLGTVLAGPATCATYGSARTMPPSMGTMAPVT